MDPLTDRQPTAAQAAAQIKLMGFDVDGTLTDGGLYFGNEGEVMKRFSVFDGQGLRLLMDHGIKVIWITARSSVIVENVPRTLVSTNWFKVAKPNCRPTTTYVNYWGLNGANAVFSETIGPTIRC